MEEFNGAELRIWKKMIWTLRFCCGDREEDLWVVGE